MLKKRIIPCLDIQNGRTVKGINFENLKDAGGPLELAQRYVKEGADELVFLDIKATLENRSTLLELVNRIAQQITIPFTVGGGIRSLEDAAAVIGAGADKISLNSAAVANPSLISQIANRFGSQCVVVAIDTQQKNGSWTVYTKGGSLATSLKALDWAMQAEALGAGEVLLTSMDQDGTRDGFALDITAAVSQRLRIPVIASGGAGKTRHFSALFEHTQASAALAASIFHFGDLPIPLLKNNLKNRQIPVR